MNLTSKAALTSARDRLAKEASAAIPTLLVCCGTGCRARGAVEVAAALERELAASGGVGSVRLNHKCTGCHGLCERGPLVSIEPEGTLYTHVRPVDAPEIVAAARAGGTVARLLYKEPKQEPIAHWRDIPFYARQSRVALGRIGRIDPQRIEDAIALGAYAAAARALTELSGDDVLREVEVSGLRGRGGAGFVTGRKWKACRKAKGERKFVLCNGDEGDPGAFKDCALMEGDPHAVLEGMLIGAYAVGAHEGYIYVRDEYPKAVETMQAAITQARDWGLLGSDILGSGFSLELEIARGGGAFVCGESSALMRSIEGKAGEPRVKYIHATERGLFDCPTVLNNVETWSHVPAIIARGGAWFGSVGTEKSKGTKAFSLSGRVKNTGVIELPMGTSLRDIIFGIGGGIQSAAGRARRFKAVQTGGPSGGCLPESALDLPVDFERLSDAGSMMGSGGMIVMDERTCMVGVARYFVQFLVEESCGKCTPCREGLKQLLVMLEAIEAGAAPADAVARIERLAGAMQVASLCELGKSAANPVLSTLRYFRDEYEAHVRGHVCPAGICRALTTYRIEPEACPGCRVCVELCPTRAIVGAHKQPHRIDSAACIACGACHDACPTGAIRFAAKKREEVVHANAAH